MTTSSPPTAQSLLASLFGEGAAWNAADAVAATAWTTPAYDLLWHEGGRDAVLRRAWDARKGLGARPLVLLAPTDDDSRIQVCGPQHAKPIRVLPSDRVLALLERAAPLHFNEAASMLTREFIRLEEAALPGLRVKELLTPHFVRERLPASRERLETAIEGVTSADATNWRPLFQRLGYRVEQLQQRGYLLREASGVPIAVVHPSTDADAFGLLTADGALPEGLLLADCERHGAAWGVLAAGGRYRLFQRRPVSGAAGGQWLEIDTSGLEADSRYCLGLLAPESLREDGWLAGWAREARDFGEQLRVGLERRLIEPVLPAIARGLGEHLESQGVDPGEPEQLRRVSEATLTLVFRFMFLLHVEARGYLPVDAAAYRPRSATVLAEDCRNASVDTSPSARSTQFWDRLRTLVGMIRTGDEDAGVPPYNGQLFAADGFPGSELLEEAAITNARLAPALAAIAYETDKADAPGLDYAGLQIGHLGAIYEALLSLRLTRAPEDLAYDARHDVFRPPRAGETPEVTRRDLYFQSEAGGRKAGGVFYTRHEFVRHLLKHSLEPALDAHLGHVREVLDTDPNEAARLLFDFSVLDPAMGSAHFLTAALDVMADRYGRFLAEVPGLPGVREQLDELRRDDLPGVRQPEDGDLVRRLILKRCIYGVDVSPMAVEVANVTLWLASFVPGLALSWLDGNLKCGDALIGVADPKVVGRSDSPLLTGEAVRQAMERAADVQRSAAAIPDRTPEEVARSEARSAELREVTEGLRAVFDLWAAEPLGLDGARHTLETNTDGIVEQRSTLSATVSAAVARASDYAARHRFLHWPLEFPGVFQRDERPGFDAVIGNPPWDEVNVEELAFYALRDPGLRGIKSVVERTRRVADLDEQHPEWRGEFEKRQTQLRTARRFLGQDGGYELQGAGNLDLYELFCERYTQLVRERGYLGVVLPRSAFLTKGAEGFRRWLFAETTVQRVEPTDDTAFRATGPSASLPAFEAATLGEGVEIPTTTLGGARVIPLLRSQRHADVLAKMRRGVEFGELRPSGTKGFQGGASTVSRPTPYQGDMNATLQKSLFQNPSGGGRIAVWRGRSFDQYDPHGNEPAGWGDWDAILDFAHKKRLRGRATKAIFPAEVLADPATHPINEARIAFRDVTNRTNSRTVIACLVPPRTPLTNKAPYLIFSGWHPLERASVLGVLNSLPFDWLARRYVETNVNFFILDMLCFPSWDGTDWQGIGERAARLSCIDERFAGFAAEADVEYGPLGDDKSAAMRAEIDALVARGFGLTPDELRFVFEDFTEDAVTPAYRQRVMAAFEAI